MLSSQKQRDSLRHTLWVPTRTLLLLAAVVVCGFVFFFVMQNAEISRLKKETDAARAQAMEMDVRLQELTRSVTFMETDAYIEQEARRLGYLREGEIRYVLEALPGETGATP